MEANGITTIQVKQAPTDAIDLLENVLKQNGITIYARINQQEEARKVGIETLPIEYLLFGNPAKGGVIMQANPVTALDLPLKVAAYQDEKQNNYIVFNDVKYLAGRYGLSSSAAGPIDIAPLLSKIFN